MTRIGAADLLACALVVACGHKAEQTTAPGPSARPQCPVSASGEPLAIDPARLDPTRTNQPLRDRLRDAAPTDVLADVSVSLKMAEHDGSPATSDAERQQRSEARQSTARAVLDAARPDLVALGVVIVGELSIRPVLHVELPACLVPTLLADRRIDRVDLGTEAVRDGTVTLGQ